MDALPEVHISFVAGTHYLRFRQNGKKIAETMGPAFLEINILRMSDLQRGIEGSEAQRYNERFVLDPLCSLSGNCDLVANALLLNAVGRGDEQELGGLFADRVFKNAFPVVAALEANRLGAAAPTANARSRRLAVSLFCTICQSSGSRIALCWPG